MIHQPPLLVTLDTNAILALANNEAEAPAVRDLITLQAQGVVKLRIDISFALERQPRGAQPDVQDQVAYLRGLGFGDAEYLAGPRSSIIYRCVIDNQPTMLSDARLDNTVVRRIHEVIHPNMPFKWNDYLVLECQHRNITVKDIQAANWDDHAALYPWVPAPQHQLDDATIQNLRILWQRLDGRWNNAKNDALAFYNHITWNGAVFVTNDKHFLRQKRREALRRLSLHVNVLKRGDNDNRHQHERTLTFMTNSEILRPVDAVAYLCEKTRSTQDEQ
jgi:hypothetical protein